VFSQTIRGEIEPETLKAVAEGLVDLTTLEGNYVPRTHFSPLDFVEAMLPFIEEIKGATKHAPRLHPIVFSILELIETVLVGTDEDFHQKVSQSELF
jgi:hypothetical protein